MFFIFLNCLLSGRLDKIFKVFLYRLSKILKKFFFSSEFIIFVGSKMIL